MSFIKGTRVQFVRTLATPQADRERYGAPYPSVSQLRSRADRRTSTDLFWGKRPLSSTARENMVEVGDCIQVLHDTAVNVRTVPNLSTTPSRTPNPTDETTQGTGGPTIGSAAAVQHHLAESIAARLLMSPNAKARHRHPLSESWSDEGSEHTSPPLTRPPSLSEDSSSSFTTISCVTTPDEDTVIGSYFDAHVRECGMSRRVGNIDVSVFEHLDHQ
ncbi:hypothetical protein BDY19DRAFT_12994 [Irpex rosettiformis]|uniref:Uncharacterized protein n=1 Tax=Irpex rosettiformis TaxID=378272 RepID=A0ACB8UKV5_9APHY|nr:hypothetical protein BDY19DRAFT_12994 [Irpex rosettiformis]